LQQHSHANEDIKQQQKNTSPWQPLAAETAHYLAIQNSYKKYLVASRNIIVYHNGKLFSTFSMKKSVAFIYTTLRIKNLDPNSNKFFSHAATM